MVNQQQIREAQRLASFAVLHQQRGRTESMIEYVDSRGVPGSFAESIILDSATEYLNSGMCAWCGARRHKSDCNLQTVSTYMSTSQKRFCTDKKCAEKFFNQNPPRAKTSRRTRW